MSPFFDFSIPFEPFGTSHFVAVIIFLIVLMLTFSITPKLSKSTNLKLTRISSIFLSFTVCLWTLIHIYFDRFSFSEDLPLSICNLFAFAAPLIFWNPRRKIFEIIYYFLTCFVKNVTTKLV